MYIARVSHACDKSIKQQVHTETYRTWWIKSATRVKEHQMKNQRYNFFTASSTRKDDATIAWFKAVARFNSPEKTLEIHLKYIEGKATRYGESVAYNLPLSLRWPVFAWEPLLARRRRHQKATHASQIARRQTRTWCWHRIFLKKRNKSVTSNRLVFLVIKGASVDLGRCDGG